MKIETAIAIADYAADEHPYDKDPKRPETYSEYNQGWHDACDHIRRKIEGLQTEEVQRWIPVTERLPENTGDVIVCHKNGWVTKNAWLVGNWWYKNEVNPITHWMPLPERPKEE